MTAWSSKNARRLFVAITASIAVSVTAGCQTIPTEEGSCGLLDECQKDLEECRGKGCPSGALSPEPGQCYEQVWVPADFTEGSKSIQVKPSIEITEIIPPEPIYKKEEQRIEVANAHKKIRRTGPAFRDVTKSVKISEGMRGWRIDNRRDAAPVSQDVLDRAKAHGIDIDAARPGTCFHEHYVPPKYKWDNERLEVIPGYEDFKVFPCRAPICAGEKFPVKEESWPLVVKNPKLVRGTPEKVTITPSYTVLGNCPSHKVDAAGGEVGCCLSTKREYEKAIPTWEWIPDSPIVTKIPKPAKYKPVKVCTWEDDRVERVQVLPKYKNVKVEKKVREGYFDWHEIHRKGPPSARTRTGVKICLVEREARYKDIPAKEIVTLPSIETEVVPPEYKTIQVSKVVEHPQAVKKRLPAETKDVPVQELQVDGHMALRPIPCKDNMTRSIIYPKECMIEQQGDGKKNRSSCGR